MAVLTRRLEAKGVDVSSLSAAPAAPAAVRGGGGCPVPHAAATPAPAAGAGGCPMHAGAAAAAGAGAAGAAGAAAAAPRTILDLALEYSGAGGEGLDVGTLRDQLMTFFAAGHDTTGKGHGGARLLRGRSGLVRGARRGPPDTS
jgi:hypothetical protein